jgi:broad specificity phosphatase PhoE
MTTLLLARHGETIWHAENRYAGTSDISLTRDGLSQAENLGRWIQRHPVDSVHSSPLTRAVLTAQPAATALDVECQQDPQLTEVAFGAGEGLTRTEMRQRFPEALEAFMAAPAHQPLPGGESGLAALERAWTSLNGIAAANPDGSALVVMHSTLMRLVLCRVIGIPEDRYRDAFPHVLNAAITKIALTNDEPASLLSFNVPTS